MSHSSSPSSSLSSSSSSSSSLSSLSYSSYNYSASYSNQKKLKKMKKLKKLKIKRSSQPIKNALNISPIMNRHRNNQQPDPNDPHNHYNPNQNNQNTQSTVPASTDLESGCSSLNEKGKQNLIIGTVSVIGLFFFIFFIVLGTTRVRIDPLHNVLLKNKFSGKVNRQDVISGPKNIYFKPQISQIKFPKQWQYLLFKDGAKGKFSVTSNSSRTVEFDALVTFRLPKESITAIYTDYKENYINEILKRINEIVKNTASNFSIEDYLIQPATVGKTYSYAITTELKKIGVVTPPLSLHLRQFYIPDDIYNRYINAAIQTEISLTNQYQYNAELIRIETNTLVETIKANTTLTTRQTTAMVQNLKSEASATAAKILQDAEGTGLNKLFSTLGILGDPALIRQYLFYTKVIEGKISPNIISGKTNPNVIIGSGFGQNPSISVLSV